MADLREKFWKVSKELKDSFFERDEVIEVSLASLIAGKHVFQLGGVGIAKTMLGHSICEHIDGARWFRRQLTKFTVPEELFGAISLPSLEKGKFERVTDGKLPEAHVAHIGEVFKASSSILNCLLMIMNEREFENDGTVMKCPLVTMFGDSNELPESVELAALYDRFLVRFYVRNLVDGRNFKKMISAKSKAVVTKLVLEEIVEAGRKAAELKIPDGVLDSVVDVRAKLHSEDVVSSDRRWKESLHLVKAWSWLHGGTEVEIDDLDILKHTLWHDTGDVDKVVPTLLKLVPAPGIKVSEILTSAKEIVTRLPSASDGAIKGKSDFIAKSASAQQELGHQIEKLKELRQKSPKARKKIDGAILNIEGMITDVNNKVLAASGVSKETMKRATEGAIGKSIWDGVFGDED